MSILYDKSKSVHRERASHYLRKGGRTVVEVMTRPLVTARAAVATVSIESYTDGILVGDVHNAYYNKTIPFTDGLQLLAALESLFDTLSFPDRFEEYRRFGGARKTRTAAARMKRESEQAMSETKKGDKATFVIHVQFRRNATWQGTIQWVDQDKTQSFRSTLEMIRLIDEAMAATDEELKIQWD